MLNRFLLAVGLMFVSSSSFAYLSVDKFHAAMDEHLAEIPQCTNLQTEGGMLGKHYHYSVTHGDESINVFARMDGEEVESFEAVTTVRNDVTMRMMSCITIALMRGIEPEITDLDSAMENTRELWTGAAQRPFSKTIVLNKYTAQILPLKLVIEQS